MSNFKVYHKRGATNYKEKKMVQALEKVLLNRFEKEPNLASTFQPAKNFDELKALHDKFCVEEAEFTEVLNSQNEPATNEVTTHEEFIKGMQETIEPKEIEQTMNEDLGFVDPFNDAEPIVRGYVLDDKKLIGGGEQEGGDANSGSSDFAEPIDDASAFELPNGDDEKGTSKRSANNNSGGGNNNNKQEKEPKKPINPSFDTMDNAKKKRSTKKFAKMIVEAVCILAEKGCIWWTTKDITEDKLAEYEMNGEMDLQILLTLEDNQQATVRQWFGQKVQDAQTLFAVSEEDRNDLIDSLYEVMLEKGIAPTPMQEVIINAVKVFVIDMGVKAFMFNQQIKGVLTQLREMKAQEKKEMELTQQQQVQQQTATENVVDLPQNSTDDYLKDLEPINS
jgi:hypothetical protein